MSASYRPKKYETAVREGESRLDCIALLDELSKNLKIQGKRMTFPSNIPGSTTLQAEVYSGAMWIGCIDTTERRFENERPSHYDFKIWAENKVSLAYLIDFLNDTLFSAQILKS